MSAYGTREIKLLLLIANYYRREDLPLSSDLADTYNSVILNVVKNLKVSKRVEWRTAPETLHVVQGDTIITISKQPY